MSDIKLTPEQENANNMFLDFLVSNDNFFVIQGPAGTGKSFLIKELLKTFYSRYKAYCLLLEKDVQQFDIRLTATTNKAVHVVDNFIFDLRQNNSLLEVSTIFSLLGLKVENNFKTGKTNLSFGANGGNVLHNSNKKLLVFIDEASFVDEQLHEIIVNTLAKRYNAKIVYIGDQYQLAPVGQQFSAMDNVSCTKASLTKIMRNAGHILKTGTQFRHTVENGKFTPISYNSTDVIHVSGPEFQQRVEQSFLDPNWNPTTSKILAWKNDRVQMYNAHIRQAMKLPKTFKNGEYVITNEYIKGKNFSRSVDAEVQITDINTRSPVDFRNVKGHMVEIDYSHVAFLPNDHKQVKALLRQLAKEAKAADPKVVHKPWKPYFEVKNDWLDLRAVYASSIHKSQGSTYDTVFLDLADIGQNWQETDVARLLYVGITRAAKQVVCYGHLPDRYCNS